MTLALDAADDVLDQLTEVVEQVRTWMHAQPIGDVLDLHNDAVDELALQLASELPEELAVAGRIIAEYALRAARNELRPRDRPSRLYHRLTGIELDHAWHEVARYTTANAAHSAASHLRRGRRPVPPGTRWRFRAAEQPDGSAILLAKRME